MKLISLFSGIGGFELAAEWMGWEVLSSCEINPFSQKILKHYWPNIYHHDDIHTFNIDVLNKNLPNGWNENIVLSGGFPCQPYSAAGKRKGTADDRHLWPEMLRAIREIQPRYVVGENVRGLTNWNGGLVFDQVQADLENEGFEVLPFLLPACGVNAPHRRDRIWFVAYAGHNTKRTTGSGDTNERSKSTTLHQEGQSGDAKTIFDNRFCDLHRITPDTEGLRINRAQEHENYNQQSGTGRRCDTDNSIKIQGRDSSSNTKIAKCESTTRTRTGWSGFTDNYCINNWQNFPTVPPVCNRDDGVSFGLDGISFPKWRNESIKALGNAIVPQVAYQIFKAIELYEQKNNSNSCL